MKYTLSIGLALATLATAPAVRADPPWRNQDQAIVIPPAAMQTLLRCRHQKRPEDECFARMIQAIDNLHRLAEAQPKSVM